MSKDRARPFSRKHRRYWIPVTGTMVLIGSINLGLGFCSYEAPSELRERIVPIIPPPSTPPSRPAPPKPATGCAPQIAARIDADLPGATITACGPDRVTVVRGEHDIVLEVSGHDIVSAAEALSLAEIPAAVMRAFAIAYPQTIPKSALKRTRGGAEPSYELAFPEGAPHKLATLRPDGSLLELR